jgi:hypothetical protein
MTYAKVMLLSFFALVLCGCPSRESYNASLHKIKSLSIKGIVIYKGDLPKPYPCFGNIIIKTNNKTDTIETCHCAAGNELWNYISVGDSIIKPLDGNQIEVRKMKSDSNEIFEYPHCYY